MEKSAPLGLYELYVVETPREFLRPPPADIFGGDIPAGGYYEGEDVGLSDKMPVWRGLGGDSAGARERATMTAVEEREAERERMERGEEYEWPEEKVRLFISDLVLVFLLLLLLLSVCWILCAFLNLFLFVRVCFSGLEVVSGVMIYSTTVFFV